MPLLRTSLCQKNASLKLSAKVERENCSEDSSQLENDQKSWIYERPNTVSMPRETESNLQAWNSNPKSSESRKWPNEDIDQSIDLRVDGIPDDETYKDKQYMHRIAEQVQKLMVTKEILEDDSAQDNILSEKTVTVWPRWWRVWSGACPKDQG